MSSRHKIMRLIEDYSRKISKKFCQNICNGLAVNDSFQFSPLFGIATKLKSQFSYKNHKLSILQLRVPNWPSGFRDVVRQQTTTDHCLSLKLPGAFGSGELKIHQYSAIIMVMLFIFTYGHYENRVLFGCDQCYTSLLVINRTDHTKSPISDSVVCFTYKLSFTLQTRMVKKKKTASRVNGKKKYSII